MKVVVHGCEDIALTGGYFIEFAREVLQKRRSLCLNLIRRERGTRAKVTLSQLNLHSYRMGLLARPSLRQL